MHPLSIVVPVLDEAEGVAAFLSALAPLRARGAELIVVDGGSCDGTPDLARPHVDSVIAAPRGRAAQMNAGARAARGNVLLFLHADTVLPDNADVLIAEGLGTYTAVWGRFDVRIDGQRPLLKLIAATMNLRSRLTGIATGDQAIFVRKQTFESLGGFPDIPLMEDIALSKALKRRSPPVCLRARVTTSGRRWEKHGIVATVLLMWRLRLAYFLGANPAGLARRYGYGSGRT